MCGTQRKVGGGGLALRDPVVEHQAMVEPVPFALLEQERLALADPCGQAVYRLAALQCLLHDRACLAHGGDGRGRKRDGLSMPGGRDDLRNSQVTSIQHDRH